MSLRYRFLRGTTPGAVRDRVAPHRSKRKSMPTVHEDHAGEGDAAAGAAFRARLPCAACRRRKYDPRSSGEVYVIASGDPAGERGEGRGERGERRVRRTRFFWGIDCDSIGTSSAPFAHVRDASRWTAMDCQSRRMRCSTAPLRQDFARCIEPDTGEKQAKSQEERGEGVRFSRTRIFAPNGGCTPQPLRPRRQDYNL